VKSPDGEALLPAGLVPTRRRLPDRAQLAPLVCRREPLLAPDLVLGAILPFAEECVPFPKGVCCLSVRGLREV